MVMRSNDQLARRYENPTRRIVMVRCVCCGQKYKTRKYTETTICWACTVFDPDRDPYVDLGDGD
jgi:hypothetical protein